MSTDGMNSNNYSRGFYTPPPKWKSRPQFPPKTWMSEVKKKPIYSNDSYSFHVVHKIPSGNSPYVKAKHAQLIEKDPGKAVALFWNAINSGDRIDSALKDMAVVMKQLDRSNEAIEAIRSFRHLCSSESQESLDNVLLELYKRSGRLEEQIEVLRHKLRRVEEGNSFGGRKVKLARCHGKKVHITVEQEYARLLGNMAWAYLQQNDYKTAEEYYRKALSIEQDRNKQCNLAICLICTNRIKEAKILLQVIRASCPEGEVDESFGKSFNRASEILAKFESQEPDSQVPRACYSTDSFAKRTHTPSAQDRGLIPKCPLTQPKQSPSSSFVLLDSRAETCSRQQDEPVKCLPRRLQFENPADLITEEEHDHNDNMSIVSTQFEKGLDLTNGGEFDKKENLPPGESEKQDYIGLEEWMLANNLGVKSWADMVEEEEKELSRSLLIKQQLPMKKYSTKHRLQVFHDITPESPIAG